MSSTIGPANDPEQRGHEHRPESGDDRQPGEQVAPLSLGVTERRHAREENRDDADRKQQLDACAHRRHPVGAGRGRREGEIRDEDVDGRERHQDGQAGCRGRVGKRRQSPASRPLGAMPELAERQERQAERERGRCRDAGHHRSRVAAGEPDRQARGEARCRRTRAGRGRRRRRAAHRAGRPRPPGITSAKRSSPRSRRLPPHSPRPATAITAETIPPSRSTHAAQGTSPRTVSRSAAPARFAATAVELERDLAGDAGLERERRHGRDQRDHDQRDEHRVLRRREHAGQRDLEQRVQAVGREDGDVRRTDPESEQARRSPRRHSPCRAALLWPDRSDPRAGRGPARGSPRSGTVPTPVTRRASTTARRDRHLPLGRG